MSDKRRSESNEQIPQAKRAKDINFEEAFKSPAFAEGMCRCLQNFDWSLVIGPIQTAVQDLEKKVNENEDSNTSKFTELSAKVAELQHEILKNNSEVDAKIQKSVKDATDGLSTYAPSSSSERSQLAAGLGATVSCQPVLDSGSKVPKDAWILQGKYLVVGGSIRATLGGFTRATRKAAIITMANSIRDLLPTHVKNLVVSEPIVRGQRSSTCHWKMAAGKELDIDSLWIFIKGVAELLRRFKEKEITEFTSAGDLMDHTTMEKLWIGPEKSREARLRSAILSQIFKRAVAQVDQEDRKRNELEIDYTNGCIYRCDWQLVTVDKHCVVNIRKADCLAAGIDSTQFESICKESIEKLWKDGLNAL